MATGAPFEAGYESRTPASAALAARAHRVLPGGRTRATVAFEPHPFYAVRAQGSRVWDADGNELVDFLNNYTSLPLGHRHPGVLAAVSDQLGRGNVFGTPSEAEVELAEILCRRVPGFDRVALTTTGSEAMVAALRAARAHTGRTAIAKAEGGFHGTYDHFEVSVHPGPPDWGSREAPRAVPDGGGLPARVPDEVIVFGFNEPESARAAIRSHASDLAAVVLEPMLGPVGMIPPEPGFLEAVRSVTAEVGVPLIFDEVFAHRMAPGGAQERFGVRADLVAISKSIGSGFPIGAVGGGEELMEAFADPDPRRRVFLSGTFHGNPLSASAAIATLQGLTAEAYERLDHGGRLVRERLASVLAAHPVDACVTGCGSLFCVHFAGERPRDYRGIAAADAEMARTFHLGLLARGAIVAPSGMGCTSTATSEEDVELLAGAADEVLSAMARGQRAEGRKEGR